jgi:hypothetical protein
LFISLDIVFLNLPPQVLFTAVYSVAYYVYFITLIASNSAPKDFPLKSLAELFPKLPQNNVCIYWVLEFSSFSISCYNIFRAQYSAEN